MLPTITAAASGVIAIMPDPVGKGHSYTLPTSLTVKESYQKTSSSLWWETKRLVETVTNCETIVDTVATVSGASEGGYAAAAASLAFSDMGIDLLSLHLAAAPLRIDYEIAFIIGQFDKQNASLVTPSLVTAVPAFSAAYSSGNPDLANTDQQQNFTSPVWLNQTDPLRNVVAWFSSNLSDTLLTSLLPAHPLEVIDSALLSTARVSRL